MVPNPPPLQPLLPSSTRKRRKIFLDLWFFVFQLPVMFFASVIGFIVAAARCGAAAIPSDHPAMARLQPHDSVVLVIPVMVLLIAIRFRRTTLMILQPVLLVAIACWVFMGPPGDPNVCQIAWFPHP